MSAKRENRFVRFAVIAAVASVALAPMTFYGCGPEWARWDATQANMYFRQGNTDNALYRLRDAIQKSPRDPVLKLTLAQRLIEMGQPTEAVELADKVLEVFPDNANAILTKTGALQRLGEFETALETQLEFNEQHKSVRRDVDSVNLLAYFRALAKKDLHLAKADIEAVVASHDKYIKQWPNDDGLDLRVKATTLATLVARCCDAKEDALLIITNQIDTLNEYIALSQSRLTDHVYKEARDSFPVRQNEGILSRQQQLARHEQQAATLLTCRALLYQDLGEMSRCNSDRLAVVKLGYDSSEIALNLPDEKSALMALGPAAAFLDTRGYVCSLLPWNDKLDQLNIEKQNFFSTYENALRDLNIAILCCKVNRVSLDCPLGNSVEVTRYDRELARKNLAHQNAALLYHRQTLYKRAGNDELAEIDAGRIRELGYEPGPELF